MIEGKCVIWAHKSILIKLDAVAPAKLATVSQMAGQIVKKHKFNYHTHTYTHAMHDRLLCSIYVCKVNAATVLSMMIFPGILMMCQTISVIFLSHPRHRFPFYEYIYEQFNFENKSKVHNTHTPSATIIKLWWWRQQQQRLCALNKNDFANCVCIKVDKWDWERGGRFTAQVSRKERCGEKQKIS